VNPVRDDGATIACPVCGLGFEASGRRLYCSTRCRQAAFRGKRAAPRRPVVAKAATVYQCPVCEERYLGDQYCSACAAFCRRLGPGGPCPCCEEVISVTELLAPDQFLCPPEAKVVKTVTARR